MIESFGCQIALGNKNKNIHSKLIFSIEVCRLYIV
jgi:hypothetical protein